MAQDYRVSIASLLIHTIEVQRSTKAVDAIGGWSETWAAQYEAVRARVQPMDAKERIAWQQISELVTHKVYTQQTGISPKDRIIFGDRIFRIRGVKTFDEENPARLIVAYCEEVQGETSTSTTTTTTTTTTSA